jgi:DNA processing protein
VIVVEGTQYSGSAITARLALDQNREVCAVPGNITSDLSFAPNLLLKQGAHLIQQSTDVLEVLPLETRKKLARKIGLGSVASPEQQTLPLAPATPQAELAKHLLSFLQVDRGLHLDDIVEALPDHSPSEIIASLFDLELGGAVRQLPGRNFVKVWS